MHSLDPYLLWAELTGYRDVARDSRGRVGVIIECKGSVAALQREIDAGRLPGVQLPALYRGGVVDAEDLHFCTAWVERPHLQTLAGAVARFKLGMAVDDHAPQAAPWPGGQCAVRVVIGIVDDFVAFAHPTFAGAKGDCRVRFVWNQDAKRPQCRAAARWQASPQLGYGYELRTDATGGRRLADAYPDVLRRASHGTHVADLAAGRRPDDTEPAPDIVVVHLPRRGVDDTSGSALKMQALDALHYIIERAGPQAGVVVNLSYGTMAGAHDGHSIIEQAIDELIELRDGQLNVVLPAGNSYEARCHAVLTLGHDNMAGTLWWNVLPDDATPSFLEIWLPHGAATHISVKVSDPRGRTSGWRAVDDVYPAQSTPPAEVDFAVIFLQRVADSPVGTMILVALAATAQVGDGARASPGLWQIELRHSGRAANVQVHAWIERDDTLPGQTQRGRQSFFVDAEHAKSGRNGQQVRAQGSFNSIANGRHTIVVGGYVGPDGSVARYSGCGPTRGPRSGPSLLACSEQSPTQHGLLAAAVADVDKVRMNGTSVAAPQIARQIARCLSQYVGDGAPRLLPAEFLDGLFPRKRDAPPDPREGRGRFPPSPRKSVSPARRQRPK